MADSNTLPVGAQIQDALTTAAQSIGFAVHDLTAVNDVADPVLAPMVLQAIKEARELQQFVKQIQSAHKER